MPDAIQVPSVDGSSEWTVMIYFAGDNALSPTMISQLKAIKEAGFQLDTNVLVHFDPNEQGAPTRIYEVGRVRKEQERGKGRSADSQVGDGRNSFVPNMLKDIVDPTKFVGTAARKLAGKAAKKFDDTKADESLELFVNFCKQNFAAKHSILFLVGHGMVVGNDAFLPDESPKSGITLKRLREILDEFPGLELIGLHSCSMSAIEVAYELKGKANYLIASEGPAFVGSWPYRQLLKKVFNSVEDAKETGTSVKVPDLVESLYSLSLFNGTDFISAGYSSDLALCDLRTEKVEKLTTPIQSLVRALRSGLQAPEKERVKEIILMAHLESQSYWQETYSDLHDFCSCLRKRCDSSSAVQDAIGTAAKGVMDNVDLLVLSSDYFGATYQYSHGLSIYFPWSPPIESAENPVMKNYEEYAFATEAGTDSWFSFLNLYFKETLRAAREVEDGRTIPEDISQQVGSLHAASMLSGDPTKPDPRVGFECGCGILKNHPRKFSISPTASKAFQ